jgi:hypothetical protein
MSKHVISFSQLPEAGEVKQNDFFVLGTSTGVKSIEFKDVIFGLDNFTFAQDVSAQSTNLATISSNTDSLSGELYDFVKFVEQLYGTTIASASANTLNAIYPIGSVLFTLSSVNPSTYIPGTSWDPIAQGLFVAGVGSGVDKNGNGFVVGEGTAPVNFNTGEYKHVLTLEELPSHTLVFNPPQGYYAANAGPFTESAATKGSKLATLQSTYTGKNVAHNNIPPFYGMYMWTRIG